MSRSRSGRTDLGGIAQFRGDIRKSWNDLRTLTGTTHKRLVLGLILIGAGLRISQLWQPITYDEAFTSVFYATGSIGFILSDYTWPHNHLLYTLLVKLSIGLFGTHLWSIRLPALVAGVLCMPVFYLFVRAMFNRYVALLTLAFVAGSGVLIEYSALARGYGLTWLFMVSAFLAGRHLAKRNNGISAVLVAVFCALGMWAVPAMIYPALAIYIWLVLYMTTLYQSSLSGRLRLLLASFLLFVLLSVLAYLPVITTHSLDHLLHHPTLGENTWAGFAENHQQKAVEFWVFINDTVATGVSLLGFIGMGYAIYISSKYRVLLLSLLLGCIPLVLVQAALGPPETWAFVLFNLHLSSGIAVFYVLKFVQEKLYTGFTKRVRTAVASAIIVVGMGWMGLRAPMDRLPRYEDEARAASWFKDVLDAGDRVQVLDPNDAPFEFQLMAEGVDPVCVNNQAARGKLYALVSPAEGQTVGSVLVAGRSMLADSSSMVKVKDWKRLEIWKRP